MLLDDWDLEAVDELRGAVVRGDADVVMELLARRDPVEVAHLAGDGLLSATAQGHASDALPLLAEVVHHGMGAHADGGVTLAVQVEVVLHELGGDLRRRLQRALVGIDPGLYDEEPDPADELPELRVVPVWLDELSTHLESSDESPWGGHDWQLDLESGELWSEQLAHDGGIDLPDHWEDPDRWEAVWSLGSRAAWRDMEEFALELDDAELGDRLERAIHGRGAFGRFRRLVDEHPDIQGAWRIHAEQRRLGRARTWLADRGCRPALRGIDLPVLARPDAG